MHLLEGEDPDPTGRALRMDDGYSATFLARVWDPSSVWKSHDRHIDLEQEPLSPAVRASLHYEMASCVEPDIPHMYAAYIYGQGTCPLN
ncbi:MAG: hypothetical protein OXR66_00720 [Candidatus Woesearchaeota archaeon]|nr:hypothetical protein [Candidatus Woesearchaeota archaeon]